MIYAYERIFLGHSTFQSTDLVEQRGRPVAKAFTNPGTALNLFSPRQHRLREPSVATHQKDRALDEVFRRPFRDNTVRNSQKSHERQKTSNVVNSWMRNMGPNGTANPPDEQDRSVVEVGASRFPYLWGRTTRFQESIRKSVVSYVKD